MNNTNFEDLRGSKVLITGAFGFIGKHLLQKLIELECKIIAPLSQNSSSKIDNAPTGNVTYPIYDGTYESLSFLENTTIDFIFHLASYQSSNEEITEIEKMIDSNINYGIHVLKLARKCDCKLFINTESYFQFDEEGSYWPRNIYSASKQAFTDILQVFNKDGLAVTSLVLFDVYGPDDQRDKIFSRLKNAYLKNKELSMTPGLQTHYCVHVSDVVSAFCLTTSIMKIKEIRLNRYWVVGKGETLKSVIEKWCSVFECYPKVLWGEIEYFPNQILTPFVGEKIPGWKAQITLEEGLKSINK